MSDLEEREAYEEFKTRGAARKQILGTLEARLGLPVGYIGDLGREQNDWAYLVKLAVSVEAAVTHALVLEIGDKRLFEHFSSLANTQRLKLAHSLDLIDAADKGVLDTLAAIRNSFAHDVKNLTGSLSSYVRNLPQSRKYEIVIKLINFSQSLEPKPTAKDNFDWLDDWIRILLHVSVVRTLISLATHGVEAEKKTEQRNWLLANAQSSYPPILAATITMLSTGPTLLTANEQELKSMLSQPSYYNRHLVRPVDEDQ
jgi:hypothetical protein